MNITWNKKNTIAIIWMVFLFVMLGCEWILVGIPHVGGLNVASSQIAGQEITTGTDLGGLLATTTAIATTTAVYSKGVQAMAGILPIIFVAIIILITVWKDG